MFRCFILALLITTATSANINNAVETEMFAVPISPSLFNWTYQGNEQNICVLFFYNIIFSIIVTVQFDL